VKGSQELISLDRTAITRNHSHPRGLSVKQVSHRKRLRAGFLSANPDMNFTADRCEGAAHCEPNGENLLQTGKGQHHAYRAVG
jgi:hypothetical protein